MIAKLTGAVLLPTGVIIGYFYNKKRISQRLARLDALADFAAFAGDQIDRYLTPSPEIFRRYGAERLRICLIGCHDAENRILPGNMDDFYRVLREGEYFSDGKKEIGEFCGNFGTSYREQELRACRDCSHTLIALREKLGTELPAKLRSDTVLAFCGAVAAVIVLI